MRRSATCGSRRRRSRSRTAAKTLLPVLVMTARTRGSATDRRIAYERDLSHVKDELDELEEVRAQVQDSEVRRRSLPQIELGIRINTVIRDWLREQIAATAD